MRTIEAARSTNRSGGWLPKWGRWLRTAGLSWDLAMFLGLLVVLNRHLVTGTLSGVQVFLPAAVAEGQWWRLLTHPFVHVTWYHLALDAGAFLILYTGLTEKRIRVRILWVAACAAASLAAAALTAPLVGLAGLCGLSGAAHGLTAISALEMSARRETAVAGIACLALVTAKAAWEAASGTVMFDFMHMEMCGQPVAVTHAGGVLGGLVIGWLFLGRSRTVRRKPSRVVRGRRPRVLLRGI